MECRICGNKTDNKIYVVKEMMFGYRDEFEYFECGSCGCLQIKDIPPDMSKYYPENYYSITGKPVEHNLLMDMAVRITVLNDGALVKALFSLFPGKVLRSLSACRLTKKSKILDVGCGAGVLLCMLKNAGFENVMGADPYIKDDIKYKNGLVVHKKELREIEGSWDLIMFHHSLEHIADQQSALNTVSAKLNKAGTCLIRIPTVSSYAWRHYNVNWVQLDAPRHFCLHSEKSMSIVAGKSGLKIAGSYRDSTDFQFWGSEQYIKDIPLESYNSYLKDPARTIFQKRDIDSFKRMALALNESNKGDQAVFYLAHNDV
ncbi:MAG: class I SAM-dependent methyltransferase [Candidatus Omnitrophica bacterium]|nr:class I SAM-dependent methyltransferase [Candidatus Omnitrophota bacterium]